MSRLNRIEAEESALAATEQQTPTSNPSDSEQAFNI